VYLVGEGVFEELCLGTLHLAADDGSIKTLLRLY
jgi:hypothetical protein